MVEKDRSIIFRMLKGNRLRIELDGRSQAPGFSWIKGGEYDECDINLYREKAIGGRKSISRFLESLYVQPQDIDALFISDEYVKKYDNFEISSYQEHENKVIKIRFTETV